MEKSEMESKNIVSMGEKLDIQTLSKARLPYNKLQHEKLFLQRAERHEATLQLVVERYFEEQLKYIKAQLGGIINAAVVGTPEQRHVLDIIIAKGGRGSGNFGHAGRHGKVGGSVPRHIAESFKPTKRLKDGTLVQPDGKPLPKHIASVYVPPAWSDVYYNPDKNGRMLIWCRDVKGNSQRLYSATHTAKQQLVKFGRVDELMAKGKQVARELERDRASKDSHKSEIADCVSTIAFTGIRPGGTVTSGEVKTYGALDLEGRHVVVGNNGSVTLKFVGKKGVNLEIPVVDRAIAKMIKSRAKKAGRKGKLFPNIKYGETLKYSKQLDGGGFKLKDFRTYVGTATGIEAMKQFPKPKDFKQYRKQVNAVADMVAKKLGNTRTVALQKYINPAIFSNWQVGIDMPPVGSVKKANKKKHIHDVLDVLQKGERTNEYIIVEC